MLHIPFLRPLLLFPFPFPFASTFISPSIFVFISKATCLFLPPHFSLSYFSSVYFLLLYLKLLTILYESFAASQSAEKENYHFVSFARFIHPFSLNLSLIEFSFEYQYATWILNTIRLTL